MSNRAGRACVVVCLVVACGGGEDDALLDEATAFDEADGQELFAAPTCPVGGLCSGSSQTRPQCFAATLDARFAFDTAQTFDVPASASFNSVDLGVRRLFAPGSTHLRVEIRELAGGIETLDASPVRAWGQLAATVVPRTSTWVRVKFQSPVTLEPANGASPRYALLVTVGSGRTAVGLGCTAVGDGFPGGRAWFRKRSGDGAGGWTSGAWRTSVRDLAFAMGTNTSLPGPCSEVVGATCDDGNGASGDGCSSACVFEPGFTCAGHPSVCTDIDECATAGLCGPRSTCVNTPGSYTCNCRTGNVRVDGVCQDRTQMAAWPIPDSTGVGCTNGSSAITCPAPGEPYYGQDGTILAPAPQFAVNGGGADTVTENLTGLTWQKTVKGGGTWAQSLAYCEDLVQGGYSDWRMPSAIEMIALVDFGARNTGGVDLGYFTWDVNTSGEFWTTSDQEGGSALVWDRGFIGRAKTISRKVRCVRSAIPDASVLAANRYQCDGGACTGSYVTVTDLKTGLTFERAAGDWHPNAWLPRIDRCLNLSLGGYDDWRPPSMKELFSIVDQNTGAIASVFNTAWEFSFSGTPEIPGFTSRVYILFGSGMSVTNSGEGGRMRCVRGP